MKTVWQGRITNAAARYGESAPMAATCCNACRTCVQTNLISLALAAVLAAGTAAANIFKRRDTHAPSEP